MQFVFGFISSCSSLTTTTTAAKLNHLLASSGLAFLLGSIIMANLWLWSLLLCAFSSGTAAFCLNFYGVAQAFPFARFSFQQKDIRNKGIYPKWGKNLFKKKKKKTKSEPQFIIKRQKPQQRKYHQELPEWKKIQGNRASWETTAS